MMQRAFGGSRLFAIALMAAAIWVVLFRFSTPTLAEDRFPVYPEITANVAFWEKVYSSYSINSAVIHDRSDLSKIYGVINLVDHNLPGADELNSAALEAVEKKYQAILKKLAAGGRPSTAQERQVAAMFTGKNRRAKMAEAAEMVRTQTGQKERFAEGVTRSGAYIGQFKAIFEQHGLPRELAYLPHVESSFHGGAYSKLGAAGMWQFTRATGTQYMNINEAIDERLDPFISADAAARYLKHSYNTLGNWPMAVTSYNYGLSGIMRARSELGSYPRIFTSYQKGHFGFASRNFYSEFLAALHVAQRLERDPSLKRDAAKQFTTLKLPGFMSIGSISNHFQVSTEQLRELNPAIKPLVFNGKKLIPKGYALRLPKSSRMKGLAMTIPKSSLHQSQKRDHLYTVKKGDTAGTIAAKHKVGMMELIAANSLDDNATIYIGQRLRIPDGSASSSGKPSTAMASVNKQVTGIVPVLSGTKKSSPRPATPSVAKEGGNHETITVQPDETISLYASWLGVGEKELRRANRLDDLSAISPGQRITVPYTKVTAAHFAEKRAEYLHENESDFFNAYKIVELKPYRVVSGDSLWDICNRKFNIPLWLLKKYNREMDLSTIRTGQELTIPIIQTI